MKTSVKGGGGEEARDLIKSEGCAITLNKGADAVKAVACLCKFLRNTFGAPGAASAI